MDKTEAQKQIKLSEIKIAKLEKQLQKHRERTREDFETRVDEYKRTHEKGGLGKLKIALKKKYRNKTEKYLEAIRTEKLNVKKCNRTLNAKQVQLSAIEPVDMEAELPIIKRTLLESIEGLTLTKDSYFLYKDTKYKLIEVNNSTRRGSTEVVFQPVEIIRNEHILEDVEITGEPITCLLYRGYYILRYDGFNNVSHKMTKEEKKVYKKYYYNFYYRNRTKIKRQEAREKISHCCPYCNKEFTSTFKHQKFCSPECKKAYISEQLKKEREARRQESIGNYEKVCPICNKKFIARQYNQKFCSDKCRIKNNNRKIIAKIQAERNMQPIKCLNCGKVFTPNDHRQKHCSSKCRLAYQQKRAIEKNLVTS